jgi:two-component system chemotaxis response regulator CheY
MTHCLIVDDSHAIRTVARRIFEELDFVTGEAEDGMAALRYCRANMPDLILLDWCMPGMTGVDLVRSLRGQSGGESPIVLISTAEVDAGEIAHAVAAGIDDYLMKPFNRDALAAKLAELQPYHAAPLPSVAVG